MMGQRLLDVMDGMKGYVFVVSGFVGPLVVAGRRDGLLEIGVSLFLLLKSIERDKLSV